MTRKPIPPLREIAECPGYSASEDGRIFSHWHRVGFGPMKIDLERRPRELRQFDRRTIRNKPSPYLSVGATRAGKRCNRFVHELVLLAWVGPRPGSPDDVEACHGPGGSRDNRVSNLRWDTVAENTLDRARHREAVYGGYDYGGPGVHAFSDLIGAE